MSIFPKPDGPYEGSAESYRDVGMSPIALPRKAKYPPVAGCTGEAGLDVVTDDDIRHQARLRPGGNVAVRMPKDAIGIDIDVRDAGDTTVAMLAARLGALPPTLYSTSRGDGSRIAYYRVPPGMRWKDIGDGVQTVWWGHRYGVGWPSIHPEGNTYRWYTADDAPIKGVPADGWAGAATLPDAWVAEFSTTYEPMEPKDVGVLHPAEVRRRVNGALRWLGEAKSGQRNGRIFDTAVMIGGLWAQLPEGSTDEDLTAEALQEVMRKAFADIGVEPDERKANDTMRRGWEAGAGDPAANLPSEFGGWEDEEAKGPNVFLDVSNLDDAYQAACRAIGTGSLSGVFRRAGANPALVVTHRIGEEGYIPPKGRRVKEDGTILPDEDGPAQVRRLDVPSLRSFMSHRAEVIKMVAPKGGHVKEERKVLFPEEVAGMLIGAPDWVTGARVLRGVTHVPLMLADGAVLDRPGYDGRSGLLYLPDVDVPPIGDVTEADVAEAVALLSEMVQHFPFESEDDRATYFAALLTPALREVLMPANAFRPLIAIGAPEAGTGKTLLSWTIRELHGGVFRGELPEGDAELGKQLVSIFDQTTAPVVQFDNVRGVFKSSKFEALLTAEEFSDRFLGRNGWGTWTNDRLFIVTGNNLRFGGDMRRRVRSVTINANMAHPESRTGMPRLKPWVRERRGVLLHALLVLVVGWHRAGRPMPPEDTVSSDEFGVWTRVTQGVLTWAGVPGAVGGAVRAHALEDTDEAEGLAELARHFGVGERWSAGQAVEVAEWDGALREALPTPARGGLVSAKSLGWFLRRWVDRVLEGLQGPGGQDVAVVLRQDGRKYWFEWMGEAPVEAPEVGRAGLSAEDLDLL